MNLNRFKSEILLIKVKASAEWVVLSYGLMSTARTIDIS